MGRAAVFRPMQGSVAEHINFTLLALLDVSCEWCCRNDCIVGELCCILGEAATGTDRTRDE